MSHPHRSTTHKERFLHLNPEFGLSEKYSAATVFARQEEDGNWYASVALCWRIDQFCRETGRKNARRHHFDGKHVLYPLGKEFKQAALVNLAVNKAKGQV